MIFHSPFPDLEVPNMPITSYVLRHADRLAGKAAFIDAPTDRRVTYGALREAIWQVAAGLSERGVQQHDVVAIYAPNSIEYAIAFHAIATLGATVSAANSMYLAEELNRQLVKHKARFLIVSADLLPSAVEAALGTTVREIFVIGADDNHPTFETLLASTGQVPLVQIDPQNDVAAVLSSSGTTGMPKGVMLTHRALVAVAVIYEAAGPMSEQDVRLAQQPFSHVAGVFSALISGLSAGLTSVVIPRFDFARFLQLIQDYHVTRTSAAPPVFVKLAKDPIVENYDLSSLAAITCTAAPLGAEIEQMVRNRIGCLIKQGYGLTEIAPTHVVPDDAPPGKSGSVGVCAPNVQTMVVEIDSGVPLGPGQSGELWLRGPMSMKGYLDDPVATAATLDADGWIHTGDLGYADEDGYFYIVDRLKELIKYKGYQVAPAELEALLLTHAAVADVAVVRSPDEDAGEVPKAFVVTRAPLDGDELMAWVAERVAPYKKIRKVEFIDVIPKSASGKILRRELIERDRAATPVPA